MSDLRPRSDLAERDGPAYGRRERRPRRTASRSRPEATGSPTGSTTRDLRPRGLFVRDIASGEESRIADGAGPQWSPDGERIAFLSDRDKQRPVPLQRCVGNATELYVIDADGSDERRLTETTAHEDFAGWTPDGEWVLFSRIPDASDDYDLFAVRADGECEVRLTDTPAWEWSASWTGPTDSLEC